MPEAKSPAVPKKAPIALSVSVNENAALLREYFGGVSDLTLRVVHTRGFKDTVLVASMEGLADKELVTLSIMNRLDGFYIAENMNADMIWNELCTRVVSCSDVKTVTTIDQAAELIMAGFACVFVCGCSRALAVGVQGYAYRSVDDPETEILQRGSREGFVEPIKINLSLLRRRIKSPDLRLESLKVGKTLPVDVTICYLEGAAPRQLIDEVKRRLEDAELDSAFTSGCLTEYLDGTRHTLFCGVGVSERPDTVCAKLCEGKAAIIVDGTPSVLIVPHLMAENFSTLDDYSDRPYFAAITRWFKYGAFAISVLLPGVYAALAGFSPEFFPNELLTRVTTSVSKTPFSVFAEVLLFTFIYEIMREAGLRLPKSLGHAVSIIGGLVIGDTAVTSGFIGAPTLMIVALTVICSYVIPDLYAPIALLRFLFIIAGGLWGIWGVTVLLCVVTLESCAKESFGVPFMLPVSPLQPFGLRDVVIRAPWRVLTRRKFEMNQ